MEKIVTLENLHSFAYCNHRLLQKPVRGIVLSFFGLGGMKMFEEDTPEGCTNAEQGILYLVPYQNPWAWMNRQNVAFTDELVDVLFDAFHLVPDTPIVSTGGSMGGLSALVYMVYAKRTPVACVANCPVCDLPFHFTERPDLPRTLYSAFYSYPGTLEDALQSASPLHLVDKMPVDADYFLFHCEADDKVSKQLHSDRFVEEMQKGHRISYFSVPDRGHCDLTDEARAQYYALAAGAIDQHYL